MAQAASSCTAASNNATLGGRATADNAAGSPSRCTSPRCTIPAGDVKSIPLEAKPLFRVGAGSRNVASLTTAPSARPDMISSALAVFPSCLSRFLNGGVPKKLASVKPASPCTNPHTLRRDTTSWPDNSSGTVTHYMDPPHRRSDQRWTPWITPAYTPEVPGCRREVLVRSSVASAGDRLFTAVSR